MIDLDELALAVRQMTHRQAIYQVLREELTAKGYWRNLPRGNPAAGLRAMQAKLKEAGDGACEEGI